MRVSYNQLFQQSLNRILELQRNAAEAQLQIASGKRIIQPGDDPVAAATVMQVNERIQAATQFDRNGAQAEQRLTQAEDVMRGASNALQRVHELVLQGRNETLGVENRRAIALEVREHIDVLVDLGNTRNASGEYIFSGAQVTTRPFTRDVAGNVSYNGDQVVRQIQISETRTVGESFSGDEALMAVRNGNGLFYTSMASGNTGTAQISDNIVADPTAFLTHDFRISFTSATTFDVIDDTLGAPVLTAQPYTSGNAIAFSGMEATVFGAPNTGDEFLLRPSRNQSMFETLTNIAQTLETDFNTPAEAARFGFEVDRSIEDLDLAIEQVGRIRATAGARLNSIENQRDVNADTEINLQNLRSNLEDIDFAAAISQLARETTALEAAQAAFVRVQGLSLFNFLR